MAEDEKENDKPQIKEKRLVGHQWTYIADVGAGQQFQVIGNFHPEVTQAEVEQVFGKFRKVIEKHRTMSAIPGLKKEIHGLELNIKQAQDSLSEIAERAKTEGKTKTFDKTAHDTTQTNLRKLKLDLEERKKMLAEWEAEVKEEE